MRITLYHSLLSFVVLFAAQGILYAQESGSGGVPENDVYYGNPEKEESETGYIFTNESEGKASRIQVMSKDSLSFRSSLPRAKSIQEPVKESKSQSPNNGAEDSILSFNFLYFIIQKYKLQDIID